MQRRSSSFSHMNGLLLRKKSPVGEPRQPSTLISLILGLLNPQVELSSWWLSRRKRNLIGLLCLSSSKPRNWAAGISRGTLRLICRRWCIPTPSKKTFSNQLGWSSSTRKTNKKARCEKILVLIILVSLESQSARKLPPSRTGTGDIQPRPMIQIQTWVYNIWLLIPLPPIQVKLFSAMEGCSIISRRKGKLYIFLRLHT